MAENRTLVSGFTQNPREYRPSGSSISHGMGATHSTTDISAITTTLNSTCFIYALRHMINQTVSVSMERLQVLTTGLPREKARLPGPLVAGTARKLHAIATSTGTLLSLIVHHCTMVTSTYERDCRSSATRLPVAIPTRHVCACMYLT